MDFIGQNLSQGEGIVFRTKTYISWPSVILLCLIFLPIGFSSVGAVIWTVCAAVTVGGALLRERNSDFVVTNRRVIIKVGLLSVRTVEMNISKIETVAVSQGWLARLDNGDKYGDLTIVGSGGTREKFSRIKNPIAFRKAVQQVTDHRQQAA